MRDTAFGTRPPPFHRPIDLDAHFEALPAGASAKGLFLRDPIKRMQEARPDLDVFAETGVRPRRLLPFFDYPYEELVRLLHGAAGILWPSVPRGEALRRLGQGAYAALLNAQVGRVLFGALGKDFARVAAFGARGWQVSVSFGEVRYEELGPCHGAYHFRDFPALLETYQVGVIEGAMEMCGVKGEVWSKLESLGDGTLELWWES